MNRNDSEIKKACLCFPQVLFVGFLQTILHLQWSTPCAINTAASRQESMIQRLILIHTQEKEQREEVFFQIAARMRLGDGLVVEPATQKVMD